MLTASLKSGNLKNGTTFSPSQSVHIDLDGAWPREATECYVDCQTWGRRLRYSATSSGISQFYQFIEENTSRFTLYGSGDFHHLTALWLRKFEESLTLISFDNHPDSDIRPPRWCCGTWINRALELPNVRRAVIWGCGNYELHWPGKLFVNRKALRDQRLEFWPWTERLKRAKDTLWAGMTRKNWREKFAAFAQSMAGENVYVTVDLDCLDRNESITNWENGLFTIDDVCWALGQLRAQATIVGGDLCGAYSKPRFERWKQRIESRLDHPRTSPIDEPAATIQNTRAFQSIWNALTTV